MIHVNKTPNQLFEENQKLVGYCYKKFIKSYNISDKNDIIQEGLLELWKCCLNYDSTRGTQFSTYACPFISGRMLRYLRDKTNIIRVPRTVYESENSDLILRIKNVASLDSELTDDSNSTLLDTISDTSSPNYEGLTEDLIEQFLQTIKNKRDRNIMEEYYYSIAFFEKPKYKYMIKKYNVLQPTYARIIKKYNNLFKEFIK